MVVSLWSLQVLVVTDVTDTNIVRITGKFPNARYFSFQTSSLTTGFSYNSLR